jgi:hypothetical protein
LLALAFAVVERQWRAVTGWIAVLTIWGSFMAWHAAQVSAVLLPNDITSKGWHGLQGFSGFLKAEIFTSTLQPLPLGVALMLAALPLVGWASLRGRIGLFCNLLVWGYALMIGLFSRADTFYWGAIMLPWYFVGYVLLPRAVLRLYAMWNARWPEEARPAPVDPARAPALLRLRSDHRGIARDLQHFRPSIDILLKVGRIDLVQRIVGRVVQVEIMRHVLAHVDDRQLLLGGDVAHILAALGLALARTTPMSDRRAAIASPSALSPAPSDITTCHTRSAPVSDSSASAWGSCA